MLDTKMQNKLASLDIEPIQADEINIGLMVQLNERRESYLRSLAKVSHYARADHGGGRDGQKRETVKERQDDGSVVRRTITAHSWAMMKAKGQIDMATWAAGDAMAADFHMSRIAPIRATSYETIFKSEGKGAGWGKEKMPKGMKLEAWYVDQKQTTAQVWTPIKAGRGKGQNNVVNDGIIDAVDRLKKLRRLVGDEAYEILEAVCIHGDTYGQLEMIQTGGKRKYGTRKTIAKKLKAAIEEVGVFYGLWKQADGKARRSEVVHY